MGTRLGFSYVPTAARWGPRCRHSLKTEPGGRKPQRRGERGGSRLTRKRPGNDGTQREKPVPRVALTVRRDRIGADGANDLTTLTTELPWPFRREPLRAARPAQWTGPRLRPLCALLHVLEGLGRRSTDCRRARPCGHRAPAFRLHRPRFKRGRVLVDQLLVERGGPRFCGGLHAPTLRGALRTHRTLTWRGRSAVGVKSEFWRPVPS